MAVLFETDFDFSGTSFSRTIPDAATQLGAGGTYGPNPLIFVLVAGMDTTSIPTITLGGITYDDGSGLAGSNYFEGGNQSSPNQGGIVNVIDPRQPSSGTSTVNLDLGATLSWSYGVSAARTALLFVLDPEDSVSAFYRSNTIGQRAVNPFNGFASQNQITSSLNPGSVAGSWEHTYDGSSPLGDFLAKFAVGVLAELSTDTPPYSTPDLVGGLSRWSMIGARQNGTAVVAAALWTRDTSGPPLDFSVNWSQPNGWGVQSLWSCADTSGKRASGGSFGTIIGD